MVTADRAVLQSALRHALGFANTSPPAAAASTPTRMVLLAGSDPELERRAAQRGLQVRHVTFTPYDSAAAQQVADIVTAAQAAPGAMLVATRDYGLAGLLASAITPLSRALLDVGDFDPSSDDDFLGRLYIPGLRRAGDLATALSMAAGPVVLHDAGAAFTLPGARIETRRLTAAEIADLLAKSPTPVPSRKEGGR